jgi:UDP-3-O-[3-hydroxymyristoyl] N-acetylglucosamine deacetylase
MARQLTLRESVTTTGIGLHSGKKVRMTIRPAAINTGIVFRRMDQEGAVDIPAHAQLVTDTMLGTNLESQGTRVATVEHLLSAMAGLGIDNAIIELNAMEVPIMDGSAGPFVFLIQSVGLVEQKAEKTFIRILKSIEVKEGDKWARFDPYEGFRVNFEIEFDHPVFRRHSQKASMEFSTSEYVKQVSRARTFGFMRDLEMMRSRQLALGGTLDNAIVLDDFKMLNEDGLRFEDEFVKHKMLDAIGDLSLLGHPLVGEFSGFKSGHGLNNKLARALLADQSAWVKVSFQSQTSAPVSFQWVPATI